MDPQFDHDRGGRAITEDAGKDCLSESELDRLSTEQLLDYVVEQRELGRPRCAKPALALLAWGYWNYVCLQVGRLKNAEDEDDVAQQVMESAIKSAFDGRTVGEFVTWLKVIAKRRRADYWRERKRKPDAVPLPDGSRDDEDTLFRPEPGVEDETDAVAFREAAGRVLELRSETHQLVIRAYGPNEIGYMGLNARETAAHVESVHLGTTMSEANVHQIWKRFKTELERELGLGGS